MLLLQLLLPLLLLIIVFAVAAAVVSVGIVFFGCHVKGTSVLFL